jgi:hypothetical protein
MAFHVYVFLLVVCLCWLLVISVSQHGPVRTPHPSSCSLPIPKKKSILSSIISLIFTQGNVYHAKDSQVRHRHDTLVSSLAPPPLRSLDQTRHPFAHSGDADRPCQEQIRTGRRKCLPSPTTDHPAATSETACLYQNRSDAPGASSKDGTHLEASAVHRSGRRRSYTGIVKASSSFGSTSRGQLLSRQGSPRRRSP